VTRAAFIPITAAILAGGCTDWDRLSNKYDGAGVCPTYIVVGDVHTCVRKSNGALDCWGDNRFGQLGLGDLVKRTEPARTGIAGGTAKIYAPTGNGEISSDLTAFTCALGSDGAFYCWGDNRFGQLGSGTPESSDTPVEIPSLRGRVAKAASGSGHVCVQTTEGELYCWGRNVSGQLGTGDTRQQPSPVKIDVGRPIEKLATGGDFTCARATDATLFCWGVNTRGQLGLGTTDAQVKPTQVKTLGTRTGRLATGGSHACVFTEDDGKVWCWGDNRSGQLGTGDTERQLVPIVVDPNGLGSVKTNQLLAGGSHTCALRDDNTLWCWGGNRFGQLGTGDADPRLAPTKVLDRVAGASAGGAHTCAIKTDGSLWCWGNNQYGQLGVDVGSQSLTPAKVMPSCQ
jgi:alpha-tubulin suppressor-like RCC1 family protein